MHRDNRGGCNKLNSEMCSNHAPYAEVDAKVGAEDVSASTCNIDKDCSEFKKAATVAFGYSNCSCSAKQNGATDAAGLDSQVLNSGCSSSSDFADDLDHIVLKERQRMLLLLLSRKMLKPARTFTEETSSLLSHSFVNEPINRRRAGTESLEKEPVSVVPPNFLATHHSPRADCCQDLAMHLDNRAGCNKLNSETCSNHTVYTEVDAKVGAQDASASTCGYDKDCSEFEKAATVAVGYSNGSSCAKQNGATATAGLESQGLNSGCSRSSNFADDLDHIVLTERQRMLLLSRNMLEPAKTSTEGSTVVTNSVDRLGCAPASASNTPSSDPLGSVIVKAEPLDPVKVTELDLTSLDMFHVKSELDIPNGHHGDNLDLDHMKLQDRMKHEAANDYSKSKPSGYFSTSRKVPLSESGGYSLPTEAPDPIKITRIRKRKKTATDSVETALEEDAPGLLKLLVEQGVSVDEIKLYGVADGDDEPIDESFIEDGFADLEDVMTKLFFQRNSLLKLVPGRAANLAKPSYCLSCLFSLVEQARYLQFRDWPAQWGWCRDLQAFIFVFERHNRIVLERPEYGYATYFFELVDLRPIQWQIKRLVIAMKLTGCGRITLIENKPLKVGEDLSEGEAKVLMQYGWTPNTGLGTMLNYCDRVVHDKKSEKESLEWRSKIGKLLMDGYNGGTVISANMESATDWSSGECAQVKMEL